MSAVSFICTSETQKSRNNKGDNINAGNIPCRFSHLELMLSRCEDNTECWIFIPSLLSLSL